MSPVHKTPINLRRATVDDVPAIAQIEELAFSHPAERFAARRIRYLISSPRATTLVGDLDGRVVGWAAGFVWTRTLEPWGRIYAVAVHPETRGQRLGSMLTRRLISELESRGARRFVLEVRPDNTAAVRLYERLGFTHCVLLPNYYATGLDARRMIRG
jgi:ribosomal-protein-alanine acetyltransferase